MSSPDPQDAEFHRLIAELTSDFAWSARVEPDGTLVVERVTDGFTRLFGYTTEELRSRGWENVLHPDERPRLQEGLRRLLSGEALWGEVRHVARDGTDVWLNTLTRPVLDEEGRVVRLIGAGQDVSARRRAEEALREQAEARHAAMEQLQLITETMSAAVAHCSRDLRYLWMSPPYARWFKRRPEEMIGRPIREVIGDEAFAVIEPYVERVLSGEQVQYEKAMHFDGVGTRWIHAVYTPTFDAAGVPDGWVSVAIDIDRRKRSEEALKEADRRKDEFLAVLAHELRNPLAPIRNAVSVLNRPGASEASRAWSREVIGRQVDQMARLLDDLLDVSRIARDKLTLRRQRVTLEEIVEAALETSRPLVAAGGHTLTVSLPEEPIILDADPIRLAQVFANLLNNAAKYTDPGGRIGLTGAREGDEVVVSVTDTGIGITPEMLPRLFEIFSQATPARERSQGGLGIGLSLVRGLVHMHGGEVEATSEGPGRGSEFTVRLPVASLRDGGEGARERQGEMSGPAPGSGPSASPPGAAPRRVLVADDNRDAADSLAMVMELLGYEVRAAYDGAEAVGVAADFRPQVYLLDLGMPKLNGYEVARRIRRESWGRDTYLVAVSGWGQEEDRRRSREAGFDHHLVKPVAVEVLDDLLRRFMPRSTAETARRE